MRPNAFRESVNRFVVFYKKKFRILLFGLRLIYREFGAQFRNRVGIFLGALGTRSSYFELYMRCCPRDAGYVSTGTTTY